MFIYNSDLLQCSSFVIFFYLKLNATKSICFLNIHNTHGYGVFDSSIS